MGRGQIMLRKLFFIIFMVFYSSMSFGKTLEIEMLNKLGKEKMVYSIKVAKVDQNDKVIWKHVSKGHNVEFLGMPKGVKKFKTKIKKIKIFGKTKKKKKKKKK